MKVNKSTYNKLLEKSKKYNLYDFVNECYYVTNYKIKLYNDLYGFIEFYECMLLNKNTTIQYKLVFHNDVVDVEKYNNLEITLDDLEKIENNVYTKTFDDLSALVKYLLKLYKDSDELVFDIKNIKSDYDNIYIKSDVSQLISNQLVQRREFCKISVLDFINYFTTYDISNILDDNNNKIIELAKKYNYASYINDIKTIIFSDYHKNNYFKYKKIYNNRLKLDLVDNTHYNAKQRNLLYIVYLIEYVYKTDTNRTANISYISYLFYLNIDKLDALETAIEYNNLVDKYLNNK